VADTLQDLRRHIDDLIGRLSEEEEHIVDPVDAAPSQAPEGLDTQIETLGHKIEGASDVLAELSDLLESQTERIETIEHQLGEPEDLGSTPAAVQAGRPSESADRALPALEIAMQQGLARVEQRLLAIEARLGSFEAVVAELRGRALQRDREACDLEDRVLALAEAALSGTSEVGAVAQGAAPAPEIVEPASTPVAESAAPLPQPQAQVLPQTAAVESRAEEAPSVEILDSAAAKRLEELVEREVRLQHQFDPGAAVEPQSRRGRPTVMVVDDSADARTVLSIYLSKTGFQVVSASSAEDCLGKLRHHRVDAVVLDASMPGASGAHVCAVLRGDAGDSAQARLPVIVYTGYPDDFTREMAEKWGADEYVVKGGDMLPLMSALIRCTEKQPPQELKQGSSATL